jgi:hypothetical protein
LNSYSPDAAAADVPGFDLPEAQTVRDNDEQKAEDQIPVTAGVLHGLGIGAREPISAANRDSA